MEWSEKRLGITQKPKPSLGYGWIRSKCLTEFRRKMMKLVKVLVEMRKAYG